MDKYGYDPREATCQWIVENLDTLKDFIPETYPRVIKESNSRGNPPLFYVSIAISLLALLLVIFVCGMTFRNQNRQSVKAAQIEFLWLLLVGLFLLAAGSIINSLLPTDFTCMVVIWLVNLGYTLELVPLIVKVAALNKLLGAARQMQRVTLKRKTLFRYVGIINAVVMLYLIIWCFLDRPKKQTEYALTDTITNDGETVVSAAFYCDSKSNIWWYVCLIWNVLLLLWSSILAF